MGPISVTQAVKQHHHKVHEQLQAGLEVQPSPVYLASVYAAEQANNLMSTASSSTRHPLPRAPSFAISSNGLNEASVRAVSSQLSLPPLSMQGKQQFAVHNRVHMQGEDLATTHRLTRQLRKVDADQAAKSEEILRWGMVLHRSRLTPYPHQCSYGAH